MKERSIEWGVSWNPVKGKCPHGCPYCYMNDYFHRFNLNPELRLDEKTLANVPKAKRILVCSSLDLFAKQIPDEYIRRVMDKTFDYPDREFFFLTKKPERYSYWGNWDKYLGDEFYPIPVNVFYGTSWDGLPFTKNNVTRLIVSAPAPVKLFVSFEPILEEPKDNDIANVHYVDWVIIGADSRPGADKPPKEWADRIIERAREYHIPVFIKSNYGYPEVIQEYPSRR